MSGRVGYERVPEEELQSLPPASAPPLPPQPQAPALAPAQGVALVVAAAPPGAFPIPPEPDAAALLERIATRYVEPDIPSYFNNAVTFVQHNLCSFLAIELFVVGVLVAQWAVVRFGLGIRDDGAQGTGVSVGDYFKRRGVEIAFALLVLDPLRYSGMLAVFNAMRTDGKVRFSDFFAAFDSNHYWRLMGLTITLAVVYQLGLMFLFPGIVWQVATYFAMPLFLEHRFLSVGEAVSYSSTVVWRYLCTIVLFWLASVLVLLLGLLALGVGVFFAIPVCFVAYCFAYHHVVGVNRCPLAPPMNAMRPVYAQPVQGFQAVPGVAQPVLAAAQQPAQPQQQAQPQPQQQQQPPVYHPGAAPVYQPGTAPAYHAAPYPPALYPAPAPPPGVATYYAGPPSQSAPLYYTAAPQQQQQQQQ